MFNKKIVSLLSAAALTASSFAALTAYADGETVLYSNNFNTYETSGTAFAALVNGDYFANVSQWSWIINSADSRKLDKLTVGFSNTSADDTAAITIKEKETESDTADKYAKFPRNRFNTRGTPQISGFDNYTANAGEDLVIAFDIYMTAGADTNGAEVLPELKLDSLATITTENVPVDTWAKVKVVTSNGTTSSVYVNDTAVAENVSGVLATVQVPSANAKCNAYASVGIDNLVIMSAADGASAVIPEADDPAEEIITEPAQIDQDRTLTYDFETDAGTIKPSTHKDYTTAEVVDGSEVSAEGKVMKIAQTSTKNNAYGYATFDFGSVLAGTDHAIIDYDIYVGNGGRLRVILSDGLGSGNGDSVSSYLSQGITKNDTATNCVLNGWAHTTVDINLAAGTGVYYITNPATAKVIGGGRISGCTSVSTISLISWSTNTSYIDNIEIQTSGVDLEGDKYTFEDEASTLTPSVHKDYTTAEVVDGSEAVADGGTPLNTTKVMKITQTSTKNNSYGYATFNLGDKIAYAENVMIDYDIYVGNSGRLRVILSDGLGSGNGDGVSSYLSQGITKNDTATNCVLNGWAHTSINLNLASGTGSYTVTNLSDSTSAGSGTIKDCTGVTTLSLVSWSPNTSYIDNIQIQYTGVDSNENVYTFEDEASTITPSVHRDYTTAEVVDGTEASAEGKIMKIAQTSTKNNSYGYATFDLSSDIGDAALVDIDYDIYVGNGGRLRVILSDGLGSGNGDSVSSYISQELTKDDTATNCVLDGWAHTSINLNLASGTGSYTVTKLSDGTSVGSGSIKGCTDVSTLSLVSWYNNTSYIDNIAITATGTKPEKVDPAVTEITFAADNSYATIKTNGEAGTAVVLKASYDEGRLAGVSSETIALKSGTTEYNTSTLSFNAGDKVMVWNESAGSAQPILTAPATVPEVSAS